MGRMRQDPPVQEAPASKTANKVASGSHPSQSSTGKLFRHDPIRLQWYPCPATDSTNGGSSERSSEG